MGLDIDVYRPVILPKDFDEENSDICLYQEPHECINKFPKFVFEKEYDVYDWASVLGNPDDYDWDSSSSDGEKETCTFIHKITKENVVIVNPPTVKKFLKTIAFESIGDQRKGANEAFYKDDIWDTWVYDLKTLTEHWNKYFSSDTRTKKKKKAYGFNVEYELSAEENRKNFKENIINKFIEGETAVIYH